MKKWKEKECQKTKDKNYQWQMTKILLMKITVVAMMSSLVLALKLALGFLPNVELVTFFFVAFCVFFRLEIAFGIINCSCTLIMLYFGVADWSIMYFIIFNFYGIITVLFRVLILKHWWIIIILTALMGYIFGTIFFFEDLLLYDFSYALSKLLYGWFFDLIHGTANAILTVIVYPVIYKFMTIIFEKYEYLFNKNYIKISQQTRKRES